MDSLRVTLDSNVMDQPTIQHIQAAVAGLPISLAYVSVTARELEATMSPKVKPVGQIILETGVWDESRYGEAVYGGDTERNLLEELLTLASNGSFPPTGNRQNLSRGFKNLLRDMMILEAHVKSGGSILVTNERKAFVGKDGVLRTQLEAACATRIMNADEFCNYCNSIK